MKRITMMVVVVVMFMMIKFDPHEGDSIPAGLQMFAYNADWHQRLLDNYAEEGEDDHDEEGGVVVDADRHCRSFTDRNDDNADEDGVLELWHD